MKKLLLCGIVASIMGLVSCEKVELANIGNPSSNRVSEISNELQAVGGWGLTQRLYFRPLNLGGDPYCSTPASNCFSEIVVTPTKSISGTVNGVTGGGFINNPHSLLNFLADSIQQYTDDEIARELIHSAQEGAFIPVVQNSSREPNLIFLMLTEDGTRNTAYRTFQLRLREPLLNEILSQN